LRESTESLFSRIRLEARSVHTEEKE